MTGVILVISTFLGPPLCIGITLACFRVAGNFPTSKHSLNILARNGEIIGANNFQNLLGKFSGPLAFLGLS